MAEGVERPAQKHVRQELRCEVAQGDPFARPTSPGTYAEVAAAVATAFSAGSVVAYR